MTRVRKLQTISVTACVPRAMPTAGPLVDHVHLASAGVAAHFKPRPFRHFIRVCGELIEARVLGPMSVTFLLYTSCCPENSVENASAAVGVRVAWCRDGGYRVEFLDWDNNVFARCALNEPAFQKLIAESQAVASAHVRPRGHA
jgi:hypothetical protein